MISLYLNLKKLIIHEIKKKEKTREVELDLESNCLDVTDFKRTELVEKLVSAIKRTQENFTTAKFEMSERFPKMLEEYLPEDIESDDSTDEQFAEFSRQSAELLASFMKEEQAAKGGYLIFTEYILQQKLYISIFLVRDTDREIFQKINGVLDVTKTKITDVDKLALACRISISEFLGNNLSPLTMINAQSREVSNYFANWLGSTNKVTSDESTSIFIETVHQMEMPLNEDGNQMSVEEFDQKLFNMINDDSQKNIRHGNISTHLFGNPDAIGDFFEKEHVPLAPEIKASRKSLKQLIEVNANDGRLKLQIPKGDLNRKVILSKEDKKVIIESAEIFDEVSKYFD